uniref:Uncharacterized protein n=1 Tax=Trichoplusia ni granulosis virus TaxID=10462 RepID=Q9PZ55_GVTN|nr:unknown [Trichoplusia ni granulovirus]
MIYGGLMEDDFKNFSLWVKSSFYSDANLLYKLCEKCVKKLCLTSKFTYTM